MNLKELDLTLINQPFMEWYEKEISSSTFVNSSLKPEQQFLTLIKQDTALLENYYFSYKILKKRGGLREIFAPTSELKEIQRKIANYLILNKKHCPNVSFGFELNTNMVHGAMKHINKDVVINLDIKNFFKSINKKMINKSLVKTFNINEVPWKLLEIVTLHGYLPTGAPSSPVLSNIYCHEMDLDLLKYSRENKLTYSRYADDLTFSTNEKINRKSIIKEITDIINSYKLEVNKQKTKVYKKSYRQEVTGLVVNDKVNLKREFRYNLKALLYNWNKHGYDNTLVKFNQKYPDKNLMLTVKGWIEFLGMVKGKDHPEYKKHFRAFKILTNNLKMTQQFDELFNEFIKNEDHSK